LLQLTQYDYVPSINNIPIKPDREALRTVGIYSQNDPYRSQSLTIGLDWFPRCRCSAVRIAIRNRTMCVPLVLGWEILNEERLRCLRPEWGGRQ